MDWINKNYFKIKSYIDGKIGYELYYEEEDINLKLALISKAQSKELFKYVKDKIKVNKLSDISSDRYKVVKLNDIPAHISNPPRIRDDIITYNTALGYTPINDKYSYLQNFKIDYDWVETSNRIDATDADSVKRNVLRGQKKMFHNQIKTRGATPTQVFFISYLNYRCENCIECIKNEFLKDCDLYDNCECFLKSAAIITMINLTIDGEVPFVMSGDNFVVKSTEVKHVSSLVPTLWFALADLSVRVRLKAVSQALEILIVNEWLDACKESLFGAVLKRFKLIKHTIQKLKTNKSYFAPDYDAEFNIIGAHNMFVERDDNEIKKVDYDDWILNFNVDGNISREMIYELQHVSPSIIVTGSIELVLAGSAQATNPENFIRQRIVRETDVGLPVKIPTMIDYEDSEMNDIAELILDEIKMYPPRLDDLESKFIEIATTNSAGLSVDERRARSEDITKKYGDNEDAKMLQQCAGVRLFDVLYLIRNNLQSWEQFLSGWNTDNVAGLRYQTGRRVRLIQMLRSVYMLSPFIIKTVLEPSIMASEVTATGKTTNDIRDAYAQCVGTSISVRANSDDVTGMDTSTHKMQTGFITNIILRYLENARSEIGTFFIRDSNTVRVKHYNLQDDNSINECVEDISVVEAMVMLDNYSSNAPRRYKAGYFSSSVYTSNISFESGTYKTSIQHTRLLSAIYLYIKKQFERKYAMHGLRIYISVLGDDQFSYTVAVGTDVELIKIAEAIRDKVTSILKKFGYITDSTFERGFGEFLKQVAICGVPIPFSVRLPQFSSERGEKGSVLDRIKNMLGVADELSARVPFSQGIVGYKYLIAMILGIFGVSKARTTSDLEGIVKKSGFLYKWMTKDIAYLTGRKLWYIALQTGIPFPKTLNSKQGCFLTFSSPAYCRRILSFAKRDAIKYDYNQPIVTRIKNLPTIQKLYWTQMYRLRGEEYIKSLFNSSDNFVPITLEERYDMNKLVDLGFYDGYMLYQYAQGVNKRLELGQGFKDLQELGNSYLDRSLVNVSRLSSYKLETMGIHVPEAFVYYNRSGARLESVVQTLHLSEGKKLSVSSLLFDMCYKAIKTKSDFFDSLGYGAYDISTYDGETKLINYSCSIRGLGPCIPSDSIQARYIDCLGLPRKSDYDMDSVKQGIETMLNVPGMSDVVLRFLGETYSKGGSLALELSFDAIGVSSSLRKRIYKLLETIGFGTAVMPYSLSPRKFFYYCTSRYSSNSLNFGFSYNGYNVQVEWAMYLSEIACDYDLLDKRLHINFGCFIDNKFNINR